MLVNYKSDRVQCSKWPAGAALACLAVASLAVPSAASADTCQLRIDGPPPSVRIEYDPFAPSTAPARMSFRLANQTDQDCSLDFALTEKAGIPVLRPEIGPGGLVLEIRSTGQVSRSSIQDVFNMTVPASETVEVELDVVVLNDAVVEAGRYVRELALELRQPGQPVAYERAPVILTLASLPRAQMNLSGARGDFGSGTSVSVVEFGVAESGKTRQVFIQTRANNQARLTFRSANKGRLMLVGANPAGLNLTYQAALDGDALDLNAIDSRDVDPPRTYSGQTFELLLTLGQVAGAQAGDYSDELTVEISTL